MGVNLFAPVVDSKLRAVVPNGNAIMIPFSFSDLTDLDSVIGIEAKITQQSNNKIVETISIDLTDGAVYNIKAISVEYKSWSYGSIYKIQLRNIIRNGNKKEYSEWSVAALIKPIEGLGDETFYIKRVSNINVERESVEISTMPLFSAYCKFNERDKEVVDKYKFTLYDRDTLQLLEDSGWIQKNASNDENIQYRFQRILESGNRYTVKCEIISNSDYFAEAGPYHFWVQESDTTRLDKHRLEVDDSSPFCKENACVKIKLIAETSIIGTYVLSRTDERSNYKVWEDLYFDYFNEEKLSSQPIIEKDLYIDYTIESGISYQYAIQTQNSKGVRTNRVVSTEIIGSNEKDKFAMIHFEHSYLFGDGVQLKLKFDNKKSSLKYTTLTQKQDTLGSKYPTISRNGLANYAEFPVTGLIALAMDEEDQFFKYVNAESRGGYYFQNELVIPARYSQKYNGEIMQSTNLTEDTFFRERIFREKVSEFLNNGGYKLYKSPDQENMVISLINVSFTPNEQLGKMIYSFSATAYQVMDFNLQNLNKIGIISIGSYEEAAQEKEDDLFYFFNQESGLFPFNTNILTDIKEKANYQIDENDALVSYKYLFKNLTSLRISAFPKIDLTPAIIEQDIIIKNDNSIDDITEEDQKKAEAQLAYLQRLQNKILNDPGNKYFKLVIKKTGGKKEQFLLNENKIYTIENDPALLKDIEEIYFVKDFSNSESASSKNAEEVAAIIDYTYSATIEEIQSEIVVARETITLFGQLAGVFQDGEEKYSSNASSFKTIDIYNSLDILAEIENNLRDQVKNKYVPGNDKVEFVNEADKDKNPPWRLKNGNKIYAFEYINTRYISIEADPGTYFFITKAVVKDGREEEEKIPIRIGPTGKYVLDSAMNLIKNIGFYQSTHAIIDFFSIVSVLEMGV